MKYSKIIIIIIVIFVIIIISIYNLIQLKQDTEEFVSLNSDDNTQNLTINTIQEDINNKIKVYIIGEVNKSGVIELPSGSRIEDAIIIAGGPTNNADLSKVNLAYQLEDGQKIYIPGINEAGNTLGEIEYVSSESGENIIQSPSNSSNKKVNINKATIESLSTIPGIGESTAQKIIEYRNENGKFNSIEDLKKISGIGDKKYEKIKEFVDIK